MPNKFATRERFASESAQLQNRTREPEQPGAQNAPFAKDCMPEHIIDYRRFRCQYQQK